MRNRIVYLILAIVFILGIVTFFNVHHILVSIEPPQPADAILVLSGGKEGEREGEAAKLYFEGFSNKLILTSAPVGWQTYTSDIMRGHLLYLGVPNDNIYEYGEVTSTREEAELSLEILAELEVETLLLVTSKYHSARAKWIFEKTLKEEDIEVISVPVREEVFNRHWWKDHETRKYAASEILKFVWELLRL